MHQKKEEKLVMQYFRKSYPDFPKGRIIPSESPDFVLKINPKRSIGIELTQLIFPTELFADIQNLIEKKNKKIKIYQHIRLSEIWLIIYSDTAFGKTNYNFRNKLDKLRISTDFDRIFLFDLFSKHVFELY